MSGHYVNVNQFHTNEMQFRYNTDVLPTFEMARVLSPRSLYMNKVKM